MSVFSSLFRFRVGVIKALALSSIVATFFGIGIARGQTTYTFSGTIEDQNGNPLSGVTVKLVDANSDNGISTTNASGSFSVSVVPGNYHMLVSDTNLDNENFSTTQSGYPLNLTSSNLTQNLTIPVYTISYSAYSAQGYSNGNNRVFYTATASGSSSISLYPGDSGQTFTAHNQNAMASSGGTGSFSVLASGANYYFCDENSSGITIGCTSPQTITGNASEVIPTTPPAPNTLSGTIEDQNGNPLSGVGVEVIDTYGDALTTTSNASGNYSVSVEPGSYRFLLSDTSLSGENFSTSQSGYPLNLTSGNLTQNLTIPIYTVSYTAYTAQGYTNGGNRVTYNANASGSTLVSLYPGDPGETFSGNNAVRITAGSGGVGTINVIGGANYYFCDENSSFITIGCASPTLVTGGTSVNIPTTPAPPKTLSGTIEDQNGNPLSGVQVTLVDAYSDTVSGSSDSSGNYSISVEPGSYKMMVSDTSLNGETFSTSQTGYALNLTSNNITQNLTIPIYTISGNAYYTTGAVNMNGRITYSGATSGSNTISLYPGDAETFTGSNAGRINIANPQGAFAVKVVGVPVNYRVCDQDNSGNPIACASPLTLSGNTVIDVPKPPAPNSLTAASPTSEPNLSWYDSSGIASSYNVYRDGTKIASTTTASYVDNNVSSGSHSYYVTAVDTAGDESAASNTVSVTVNAVVPTLGTPSFSVNPVASGQSTTLTVPVNGNLYGVTKGEYYIGSTDPGQGNGTTMSYSNGVLTATLSGLSSGSLTVSMRADNSVGWSGVVTATLQVKPAAPTGLTAPSPSSAPSLSWDAVSGATSYNIYRNGVKIDFSTSNSYTDTSLTASGTYTYSVTAVNSAGESGQSNSISVVYNAIPVPIAAVNAGDGAVGSFAADTGFSGGATYSTGSSIDTSGVTNPDPQAVFQSARYGSSFSYAFTGLTPGANYTVGLDFAELFWGTSAAGSSGNNGGVGSRVFDVGVNGQTELSNFDIFAAAGGANKAVAEEIPTTADASGNVTITFTGVVDSAMVNGLALYNGTLASPPSQPAATTSALISAAGSANGSFSADQDYTGGTAYSSTAGVDTSQVTNPAPESVYQSARYGTNFSYTIPNLAPNTSYNVRLDFNELYWGTALANGSGGAGSRVFNVAINGNQVLNNFDIFQTAGGANTAIAENFTATSDSEGRITIQFTSVTDNAMVSGIELTQQ